MQQIKIGTHKSKITKQLNISRACLYRYLQQRTIGGSVVLEVPHF